MITTNVQFATTKRIIEIKVSDGVFSALRGPDISSHDSLKIWGTAVIRAYLVDYNYGEQYNIFDLCSEMIDNQETIDVIVRRYVTSGIKHYIYHVYDAFNRLTDVLAREAETRAERDELEILRSMARFWSALADVDKASMRVDITDKNPDFFYLKQRFFELAFNLVWFLSS